MGANQDESTVSVSTEEWHALNARLLSAEDKLKALQGGDVDGLVNAQFLAMLAHEFRNPLAPIRSAVEIMRFIGHKDAALDTARDLIARQVDHLSRLVDDLLEVSRLSGGGKVQLRKRAVDVNAVLAGAVEVVRPLIDEHGQHLEVEPLAEPVSIEGDFARLVQIVFNVLNNAIKYTERGGEITLGATTEGDRVIIRVADTGVGIAPDLLPDIFDLFGQARRIPRDKGGLGIGLALVRNLVTLHGGTVEAKSPGVGEGSEFLISLPIVKEQAQPDPPVRRKQWPDMPRRIVVIDDNEDAAESLAMLLRLKGHDVQIAFDGPSGLSLALSAVPDCVLVDIGLPGMDGYEVAKRLRSSNADGHTLLVALTGYGKDEDRTRSRQAGFDHHLVKPVSETVIEDLLRES